MSSGGSRRSGRPIFSFAFVKSTRPTVGDVFTTFPQGWQCQGITGQAIIQVLAKRAILNHGLQVSVRCGNDAHIDLLLHLRANLFDFAFLNKTEQFDLKFQRHLADFVEKQGASDPPIRSSRACRPRPP